MRSALLLGVSLSMLVSLGCGGSRDGLTRNVREAFHRLHPECRGARNIGGFEVSPGRYQVTGCGYTAMYYCPRGAPITMCGEEATQGPVVVPVEQLPPSDGTQPPPEQQGQPGAPPPVQQQVPPTS